MNETETAPSIPQAQFLLIAMRALSRDSARWVCLVMSFVLFGAATWWPDWKRLAAGAAFTLLVTVPAWWRRER